MTFKLRYTTFFILIILAGCSSLAPILSTPTPSPEADATATPQIEATSTATPQSSQNILRIWLPPEFDPAAATLPAELFSERLKEFKAGHPGIEIEIRIKTDIVNFLSVTNNAAPASMPDLVALSYNQMQTAASAGFLHPLDGLTGILQDPDWYVFARELSSVQNAGYGIPFASDVMMILYRSNLFDSPPSTWESIIGSGAKWAFPGTSSQHIFPLSLYLSVSDQFVDEQGAFTLNEDALVRVLALYQKAYEAGTIPIAIRNIQSDSQSLISFQNGETDIAVVWASSDVGVNSGLYSHLLGLDDIPHSVGNGWVWAFAGSNAENQQLAVDLASHLVDSDYMSAWTYAFGYLPTRPLALAGWADDAVNDSMDDVLHSAHPIPSADVIARFGPLMQEALIRIFNGEQAEVVARSVIDSIK